MNNRELREVVRGCMRFVGGGDFDFYNRHIFGLFLLVRTVSLSLYPESERCILPGWEAVVAVLLRW